MLALSASSRQKLRGIFLQFVSAVGGAGAVGMLTEYSTLPHFKNLARYILPQHTVSSSKKDIPIFFYHKVNPIMVTAQSFDETMLQNIYCFASELKYNFYFYFDVIILQILKAFTVLPKDHFVVCW